MNVDIIRAVRVEALNDRIALYTFNMLAMHLKCVSRLIRGSWNVSCQLSSFSFHQPTSPSLVCSFCDDESRKNTRLTRMRMVMHSIFCAFVCIVDMRYNDSHFRILFSSYEFFVFSKVKFFIYETTHSIKSTDSNVDILTTSTNIIILVKHQITGLS